MKIALLISLSFALPHFSFGQLEQNSEPALEDAPILDEVVYKQGKDTLIIQRIEQPEFLGKTSAEKEEPATSSEDLKREIKAPLPTETYIISATSIGKTATRIKVWPSHLGQQVALEGWSNIDWSILQGLLSFEGDNKTYQLMLFHSANSHGENLSEVPTDLPEFGQTGARYLVTSSEDSEREEILDFLEAIHALYDEKQQKLKSDREIALEKHEERKRQIEIEAKKPKTRVLKIWRHTRSKDEQIAE